MPSTGSPDDDGVGHERVAHDRVGAVLLLVAVVWLALGSVVATTGARLVDVLSLVPVVGYYPGAAALLFNTLPVGAVYLVVGAGVVVHARRTDDRGRGLGFRATVGVALCGAVAGTLVPVVLGPVAFLGVGGGPFGGDPVSDVLGNPMTYVAYVTAWLLPLGVADSGRERAVVAVAVGGVPVAALALTVLLVLLDGGLLVLAGFFTVAASLGIVVVSTVYGVPLYLAGRVLGPRGAPGWLPESVYRGD